MAVGLMGGIGSIAAPVACDAEHTGGSPSPATTADLGAGIVARVGQTPIHAQTVVRIAQRQKVDLATARDRAIFDALMAEGAKHGPAGSRPEVKAGVRAALARAIQRQLWFQASQAPTYDEELAAATARHWLELDRPESFKVIHAVVRITEDDATDQDRARARELAARIREALGPAVAVAKEKPPPQFDERIRFWRAHQQLLDPAEPPFRDAVAGVDSEGMNVKVETLNPVARDGRVVDRDGGQFAAEFAAAAAVLRERGELSPVVETAFGYHVMMLLERIEGHHVSAAKCRQLLREEIVAERARRLHQALLQRLRAHTTVVEATNAAAMLRLVRVEEP